MSQDFTTRLQLQLREAALREERRGALGRQLAGLRLAAPGPAATAGFALAAVLVAVVVALGGIRWGGEETVSNPKVIGDVPLAENLGTIGAGFGSVWVADTDRQRVLRVDPRTRRVVAQIATGGDPNAFGGDPVITVGAGAVWAIARSPGTDGGARVLRIDPRTNRVSARVTLRPQGAPRFFVLGVQIIRGVPWAVGAQGAIELDPVTAAMRRFLPTELPAGEPYPLWITGTDTELWVLTREQRIDRYDLDSGRRAGSLPVRLPTAVGVLPYPQGTVLLGRTGELARIDPDDGRVAWRRTLGTMIGVPVLIDGTLWIHASDTDGGRDRLVEMDLETGRVLSSTGLPQFGAADLTRSGDDLWISSPAGHVMIVRR